MADRSILVTLRANVTDFKRQVQSAADSMGSLEKRAGGADKVASTAMGKIAQSATLQRDSWEALGGTLTKAGAITTGLSAAVLAVGVSYNQLQQQSRAALSTMLGGAEAANAQMGKLDAFAKTSPFAKDVFIRAQQQMVGFGIATQKVIPYLSAINEAVAATGGSNNDISELTRIFSQVQAAAKITAVDLMQFGQRGIDAATLIGSQMGKTGAQIRGEITAGTLDAGQALDALAAGMQDRFGGASASVKNTFSGAIDRVKAAFRDLASLLATPLVGPEGGGFLVDAANGLADFLRAIEAAPGPLQQFVFYGGAVVGVAALITGGLAKGLPAFIEWQTKIKALSSDFPRLASAAKISGIALGAIGVALGVATVAIGAYFRAQAEAKAQQETFNASARELRDTLDSVTGAWTAATRASVVNKLETSGALAAYSELGGDVSDLADALLGNADAQGRYNALMREHATVVGEGETAYESFSGGAITVDAVMKTLEAQFKATADSNLLLAEEAEGATEATDEFAGATADATEELEAAKKALEAQITALEALRDQAMSAARSEIALEQSLVDVSDALRTNGATLDLNSEKGRDNRKSILDAVDAANKHAEALLDQGAGADAASGSLAQARERIMEAGRAAGISEEEMAAYIDTLFMTPAEIATRIAMDTDPAIRKLESFLALYSNRSVPIRIVAEDHATATARAIAANISNFSATVRVYGQAFQASGGPVGPLAAAVQRVQYRSSGGQVHGPGGPTEDRVPAVGPGGTQWRLSAKEWVIRAASAEKYGPQAMHAINAGTATVHYRANGGPTSIPRHYVSAAPSYGTPPSASAVLPDSMRITGKLDVGGTLVDLVDARLDFAGAHLDLAGRAL